ncbi:hypothetical protein M0R45_002059 [Rubus argutus]|uniref:Uncharacterized protein n=1 Tax=Rubus argutus TaxID=59490 RepID=A0AAW1VI57_RUBAR
MAVTSDGRTGGSTGWLGLEARHGVGLKSPVFGLALIDEVQRLEVTEMPTTRIEMPGLTTAVENWARAWWLIYELVNLRLGELELLDYDYD